jgi:nucleoside-diphosphate-sugar epimerase
MNRVLITGGAGYIGSVLANACIGRGYKVRVVDTLSFDYKTPLNNLSHPSYEFCRGDICDASIYDRILEEVDFIVHTAAIVGEPASNKYAALTRHVNVDASIKLIEKAKSLKKKFIFFSTCSNYGIADGMADENTPPTPLSLYSETKIDVEKYLLEKCNGLEWVICRLSTAYGASPRMRFDLTVNDFSIQALTGKRLEIFLPYSYRPYAHVYDIAQVVCALIENFNKVKNNVFNVGFEGENYQKIQIADVIKKYIPDLEIKVVESNADMRDYRVDFTKLSKAVSIKKTYSIDDGVRQVITMFNEGLIADYKAPEYYNTSPKLSEVNVVK